jgi:AraC-like DNA-binding protein
MKKSDEKRAKKWKTHTTMRLSVYDHEIAKKIANHMNISVSEFMRLSLRDSNMKYGKLINDRGH